MAAQGGRLLEDRLAETIARLKDRLSGLRTVAFGDLRRKRAEDMTEFIKGGAPMSVAPNEVYLKGEARSSSAAYLKPAMPAVLERSASGVVLKRSVPQAKRSSSRHSRRSSSEAVALSLFYHGPSMNPVLKTPDILHLIPFDEKQIRPGDVIVFIPPGGDAKVVHRVVSADAQGIRTKGDNNKGPDQWLLQQDDIIGRLVRIERGRRQLPVYGGTLGKLQASVAKSICLVGTGVRQLCGPLYRWLGRSGTLKRWVSSSMKTRVISFARGEGTELQLVMGSRVIGRRLPGKTHWLIRRPFLLFIDDTSLPSVPDRKDPS
jgi:signal peptidase I